MTRSQLKWHRLNDLWAFQGNVNTQCKHNVKSYHTLQHILRYFCHFSAFFDFDISRDIPSFFGIFNFFRVLKMSVRSKYDLIEKNLAQKVIVEKTKSMSSLSLLFTFSSPRFHGHLFQGCTCRALMKSAWFSFWCGSKLYNSD